MPEVVLGSSTITESISSAQELLVIVADTFGGNVEWFFLVAGLGAILAMIYGIMRKLAYIGR